MHDQSGRVSRRTLLRAALGGAGAVTIASVLAACAPASGGQAGSSAATGAAPAGAATSAPAQSSSAGSGGALKIGLLSGFSGPYAAFGPDMAGSMEVYLDQHNGLIGG